MIEYSDSESEIDFEKYNLLNRMIQLILDAVISL